ARRTVDGTDNPCRVNTILGPLIFAARWADRSLNGASPHRDPVASRQDEWRDTGRDETAELSDRRAHGTNSLPQQDAGLALLEVRVHLARLATGRKATTIDDRNDVAEYGRAGAVIPSLSHARLTLSG